MNYIVTDTDHINDARGVTVVIDVLRAFSTACFVLNNGADSIIPVETLEEAWNLKKTHPEHLLLGERMGKPIDGFDYTNSPACIRPVRFSGKTIIMTTTAGTKGIVRAPTEQIITGSFVNSGAVVSYLRKTHPDTVTFVCTDVGHPGNEDELCANYIISCLEEAPQDFPKIVSQLRKHPNAKGYLITPLAPYSAEDFALCMQIDTFPFVIGATRKGKTLQLRKL